MITKFKSKDLVHLEHNPDEKMTVIFISGHEVHCIDRNNKQVIYDVTELIKDTMEENTEYNSISLN